MLFSEKTRYTLCGMAIGAFVFMANPANASQATQYILATYNNIKIIVDGRLVTTNNNNEPFIYNGTTYLPVRAVGEAVGKQVTWDGATNTVYLDSYRKNSADAHNLQNAPQTAQSNMQANAQPNVQGNTQANAQLNAQVNTQLNMQGNTQANVQQNIQGNTQTNAQPNMQENTQENTQGNAQANTQQNTQGNTSEEVKTTNAGSGQSLLALYDLGEYGWFEKNVAVSGKTYQNVLGLFVDEPLTIELNGKYSILEFDLIHAEGDTTSNAITVYVDDIAVSTFTFGANQAPAHCSVTLNNGQTLKIEKTQGNRWMDGYDVFLAECTLK